MQRNMLNRHRFGLLMTSDGGDDAGTGGTNETTPATEQATAPTPKTIAEQVAPRQTNTTSTPSGQDQDDDGQTPEGLEALSQEELITEIRRLRRKSGDRRVERNEAREAASKASAERDDLMNQIKSLLGVNEEKEPTIEDLQSELNTRVDETVKANTRAADAERQLIIFQRAGELGANASKLLDSVSFLNKAAEIDYGNLEAVDKIITTTIETNPEFRTAPLAGQTHRVNHLDGGDTTKITEVPLEEALKGNR